MASVQKFVDAGLSEKAAKSIASNAALATTLANLLDEVGESDKDVGNTLYNVTTKYKSLHEDPVRSFIIPYFKEKKISSTQQLQAATDFFKANKPGKKVTKAFEEACGVGVSYSKKDISKVVGEVIAEQKEQILEQRYQSYGRLLGYINKERLMWADGGAVKEEVEKQLAALLGPKTDADKNPGKKKQQKVEKPKEAPPASKKKNARAPVAVKEDVVLTSQQDLLKGLQGADADAASAILAALQGVIGQTAGEGGLTVGDIAEAQATHGATPLRSKYSYLRRTTVKDILESGVAWFDQDVVVAGWVKSARKQKGLFFFELYDGSCYGHMQVVLPKDAKGIEDAAAATEGASISIKGKLVRSPKPGQLSEILAESFELLGPCETARYPLAGGQASFETLREFAHLRPRAPKFAAVARVRSALSHAVHEFFKKEGFAYVHTPLITTSDCEGAGENFQVTTLDLANVPKLPNGEVDFSQDFFKKPAMLAVSGQLNVESYATAIGNVYTFGPTFRAENSHTTRHLAEFWMIEPEMAFADIVDDQNCAEDFLKHCINHVLTHCLSDLEILQEALEPGLIEKLRGVVDHPFTRITYTEAIDICLNAPAEVKAKWKFPVAWGEDMKAEHERYLAEEVFKGCVIVRDYPKDFKAFYMRLNDDQKTVAAMDVLLPKVGEIIGGSQREERPDVLLRRIEEMGLPVEAYNWYLELRKFGTVKHAGFGLGFGRLVVFCTGIDSIRDAIPFPRYPGHAAF